MNLTVNIDGGARGNPGPAGAGVTICDADGKEFFEAGFYLGEMTNNMAEYHGLLRALEALAAWPDAAVTIHSDSELLVKQMTGDYRVKNAGLGKLYEQAQTRLLQRQQWKIRHVRREQNHRADELANMAMDALEDVMVVDARPRPSPAGRKNGRAVKSPPAAKMETSASRAMQTVIATCSKGASPKGCAAPCEKGQSYRFDAVAPASLCLDALASMLSTALALRDAPHDPKHPTPPLTVRCFGRDCGAVFELRVDESKSPTGPGAR